MASQVDQFSSTQLAAFVALSWASSSVGSASLVVRGRSGRRQGGQEHGRYLQV